MSETMDEVLEDLRRKMERDLTPHEREVIDYVANRVRSKASLLSSDQAVRAAVLEVLEEREAARLAPALAPKLEKPKPTPAEAVAVLKDLPETQPKAVAAAVSGAGYGAALATILMYYLDLPQDLGPALGTVIEGTLGLLTVGLCSFLNHQVIWRAPRNQPIVPPGVA